MTLADIDTPSLILDRGILERNCKAMLDRMRAHGVKLRPHLKTSKAAEVAQRATSEDFRGICVSTLAEARYFAQHDYRDITYAVGMVPSKLPEALALKGQGVVLTLLIDSMAAAQGLAERLSDEKAELSILIEIDTGGGRAGIEPESAEILAIAQFLENADRMRLAGVLTHAGHSYGCRNIDAIKAVAEEERSGVVRAAERLRDAGFSCPVVSAGSTPTAVHADSLEGLTEMRPGVYVFGDLDQVGIGSCAMEDIALSVLASVTGHNRRTGRILIDAGGLALSKDVSAGSSFGKVGYGLVCPMESSTPLSDLYVAGVHQEHGLIAAREGEPPYDAFPIGSRVRVLPNHACMTAAAYSRYQVIDGGTDVVDQWDRVNGW